MVGSPSRDTAVVIAAHTRDRWASLCAAINSVSRQAPTPGRIIVAVDGNPGLADDLVAQFPGVTIVRNEGPRGAAATRNCGVRAACERYIAFLDDDAVAGDGWLDALVGQLADPAVVGVGGYVNPAWVDSEPLWFPPEFLWVVGATYRGMPTQRSPVRNVWSENMAVRREQFLAVGGFREGYGKTGTASAPEDTDLCIRLAASVPGSTWLYEPDARIDHVVPRERSTLRFLVRRSFNEGAAKAEMGRMLDGEGGPEVLSEERRHAAITVPRGISAEFGRAVSRRDRDAARRAGAGSLALTAAAAGVLVGSIRGRTQTSRRPVPDVGTGTPDRQVDGPVSGLEARRALTTTGTPWVCVETDIADEAVSISTGPDGVVPGGAHVLVRSHGEPIGTVWIATGGQQVDAETVSSFIRDEHGAAIDRRTNPEQWRREQEAAVTSGPALTVVISTRNRPEGLQVTIDSLQRQTYPRLQVSVVDNAPDDNRTRRVVDGYAGARIPVDYMVEPVPGLSRARNAGVAACRTELVAFLDDDEYPAADWAVEIIRGFTAAPRVDCVTGLIVPRSLETYPEQLFELWGGHSKGLELHQEVHDGSTMSRAKILFPLPPFGVGGNMAFRTTALHRQGDFDVALGAGTPVKGAEDTDMFARVLLAGGTLVYRPTAIVAHRHRATIDMLEDQLYGYGSGLTAWYLRLVLRRPILVLTLLRLIPRGIAEVLSTSGDRSESHGDAFPPSLRAANIRGMASGPVNLMRAMWASRGATE